MHWEILGSIGEIVGAAAVVVTLIYLGRQFRDATTQALQDNFQHTVDNFSSSLGNASIVRRGAQNLESLNDDEQYLFYCLMWNMTHSFALIWEQHRKGLVSESSYLRVLNCVALYNSQPGYKQWLGLQLEASGNDAFPEEMIRAIDQRSESWATQLERIADLQSGT